MKDKINLRLAKNADLESLATILNRANTKRDNQTIPTTFDKKSLKAVKDRMIRENAWMFIAEIKDTAVGFILTHPLINNEIPVQDTKTEHLSLIMVDPDYWGNGVAGALLKEAFTHAKSNNKITLSLWTRKHNNQRARSLYERYGFVLSVVERNSAYGEQVQYLKDLR